MHILRKLGFKIPPHQSGASLSEERLTDAVTVCAKVFDYVARRFQILSACPAHILFNQAPNAANL